MSKPESELLVANVHELGRLYDENPDALNEDRGKGHATNRLVSALDYIAGTGRKRLLRRLAEAKDKSFFREVNTELAKLACDFAMIEGDYTFSDYEACAEAEPRFLQCVDAMQNALPLPGNQKAAPATIYVDQDLTPIALRKNWGERTTLVLRKSPQIPDVPVGTIVGTSYDYSRDLPYLGVEPKDDEVIKFDKNPQVSVAFIEKPHLVDIARPSVFTLDPEFVLEIEYDPTNDLGREDLKIYAPEIALTSLADIVKRVDEVAASVGV